MKQYILCNYENDWSTYVNFFTHMDKKPRKADHTPYHKVCNVCSQLHCNINMVSK